jgi:hypothetical protein
MKTIFLLLAAVSIVFAIGCSRTVINEGTHAPVDVPGENTGVRWNSASVIDDIIANKIAVESISSSRSPTQSLNVDVVLMNRTDFNQQVECRTQFFGPNRVPCETPSAWRRVYLGPNGIETYSASSMKSDEVAFFYVEIREAR